MTIERTLYGTTPQGEKVWHFTVTNSNGLGISAMTLGATLTSVRVPSARGTVDVILGFDSLAEYIEHAPIYCGALVGRFANRIAHGKFSLDCKDYQLARNDGENHLHGGTRGFNSVLWKARAYKTGTTAGIRWTYLSRDGEEGYPGTVQVSATYSLREDNRLAFEYWATTEKPTPINLTNHAYWNLAGRGSGTILDHEMSFNCPYYLPVNAELSPTGEILKTAGTPFDFSTAKPIGRDMARVTGGYDHCMVVGRTDSGLVRACSVKDPRSGRSMQVWTTEPGIQFYTGNFLDGNPYPRHGAFCLETQHFPDSVNFGHFPSCTLVPGQTYHHQTVHTFS